MGTKLYEHIIKQVKQTTINVNMGDKYIETSKWVWMSLYGPYDNGEGKGSGIGKCKLVNVHITILIWNLTNTLMKI